jgi:hypothetical protein
MDLYQPSKQAGVKKKEAKNNKNTTQRRPKNKKIG